MLFRQEKWHKHLYIMFLMSFILFMGAGGIDTILHLLNMYIFNRTSLVSNGELNLHFFAVMQTVREAGNIPFETFANRISGHTITFALSIIGYIWLALRHRIMLLGLPMIGLGFLAYSGGLRFTIYAICSVTILRQNNLNLI